MEFFMKVRLFLLHPAKSLHYPRPDLPDQYSFFLSVCLVPYWLLSLRSFFSFLSFLSLRSSPKRFIFLFDCFWALLLVLLLFFIFIPPLFLVCTVIPAVWAVIRGIFSLRLFFIPVYISKTTRCLQSSPASAEITENLCKKLIDFLLIFLLTSYTLHGILLLVRKT